MLSSVIAIASVQYTYGLNATLKGVNNMVQFAVRNIHCNIRYPIGNDLVWGIDVYITRAICASDESTTVLKI